MWRFAIAILVVIATVATIRVVTAPKMVLCSQLSGRVVSKGTPVVGATVTRQVRWGWNADLFLAETTTDKAGNFTLAPVIGNSLLAALLPHKPVAEQTVEIRYKNITHQAWHLFKLDYRDNSENHGKPIAMVCDFQVQPTQHNNGSFGICRL